ncbi:GLPGLI family protein [Epilithonimonas sp.]|uniref:GLPGLI family protein n=1 Tax=Epilithonimonas sp. TaxID=2894511 RepID=UPI002FDE78E6
MKTYIILLLIFLNTLSKAQTHRFVYQFDYKPDSTSANKRHTNMVLDVNPDEIKFYEFGHLKNDSINKSGGRSYSWSGVPALKRKKNSSENINYEMMRDYMAYTTIDKMDWKLENETKTSGQYTLQKATTNFGGRHWTAWFCKDLNISEGPYKFRGLPGLIFELNDDKDNFNFKLVKSTKLPTTYETFDFLENFGNKKSLTVPIAKFKKMQLDFFNDPLSEMKEKFDKIEPGTFRVAGVEVRSKDQFKDLTKKVQEHILKTYNPLDLTNAINYPVLN